MDEAELQRIARLARLEIAPAEARQLAVDITALLDAVAVLNELEPAGAPAGAERTVPPAPAEPDSLHTPPSCLAPDWRDGYFAVPRQ